MWRCVLDGQPVLLQKPRFYQSVRFPEFYNIQNIRISDLRGKTIVGKKQIQEYESIDLSSLKSGVYIISIQTDIETITTKIVKE